MTQKSSGPVAGPKEAPADSVSIVTNVLGDAAQAVSVVASDPDRVVGTIEVDGVKQPVTQRDISRSVSSSYRREISAMLHARRLAANIANGLLTLGEVPDSKRLDVTVELRREGFMPRPDDAS